VNPSSDAAPADTAPWFYRKRFAVFGLTYGLAFFFGFLIAGLAGIAPVPVYRSLGNPVLGASIAGLAVVAGFALRVWASSYLSSSIVWQADPQSPQLRVSGPYRFTRNPLYLGNVLQAIGIGLVGPWPVLLLVTLSVTAFNYALIFVEEPFLAAKLGNAYAHYRATVPRLIPLPGKFAPAADQPVSLRDGLRAEAMIGLFALIIFAGMLANAMWSHP
jgi:protein-S-isoprenylcysteine O-methyltransferase Ste14